MKTQEGGRDDGNLREEIERLRARLSEERSRIETITDLLGKEIEREAGLWEYGFEELEAEMWRRFGILERNQGCLSEDRRLPRGRAAAALFRRLRNLYRSVSGPFSRTIVAKPKQFNLDRQDLLNRESIPFQLAVILTLQKVKDRLNRLEDAVIKLQSDQDELEQGLRGFTHGDRDESGQ